jgi:hypothetical protein
VTLLTFLFAALQYPLMTRYAAPEPAKQEQFPHADTP